MDAQFEVFEGNVVDNSVSIAMRCDFAYRLALQIKSSDVLMEVPSLAAMSNQLLDACQVVGGVKRAQNCKGLESFNLITEESVV